MNPERVKELWVRYLSGEKLSLDEEREVVDALRQDPELRNRLLRDVQLDGALRGLGWGESEKDVFAREFSDGLAAERDGANFTNRVERRVKGDPAKTTRRSLRPPSTHSGRLPWLPVGIAAAAILGLVLALGQSSPDGPIDPRAAAWRRKIEGERAAAHEAKARAEARLQEIDQERAKISAPQEPPAPDAGAEEARMAELARLLEEKGRIEREMKAAILREQKAREDLARVKESPPESPPKVEEPPPAPARPETKSAVAMIEQVEGEVFLIADGKKVPAKALDGILAGQGLETGPQARAIVVYDDKTRLEIEAGTLIEAVSEKTEKEGAGKRLELRQGALRAEVTKQPPGRPLVIRTPQGEARVLGTTLKLLVDSVKNATELQVWEGRVRLTRADGKAVEVMAGHYAVAAAGAELAAKPLSVIGHWTFDEERGGVARDASGKGRDARIVGAVSIGGKIGRGLGFNGKDSYVGCGPVVEGTGPFTVSAWVLTVQSFEQDILYQSPKPNDGGQFRLGIAPGGRVEWNVFSTAAPGIKIVSDKGIADGKWHHVAAVREKDGTVRLFIDGKPTGGAPTPPLVNLTPAVLYLGAHQCCTKGYLKGAIDDVRVYDRALPPEEVAVIGGAAR